MKINKVTLTGIDDETSIVDLKYLNDRFPFVEFGVLFGSSFSGKERYPTVERIEEFISYFKHTKNLSAHLCGSHSKMVLEKGDMRPIDSLVSTFQRIQLNYSFYDPNKFNLTPLLEYIDNNPKRSIIIQANGVNEKVVKQLNDSKKQRKNLHFLYDSSGGRGVRIARIKPPFSDNYTAYAGGIDVYNIADICAEIESYTHESFGDVWIDMESGVRRNGKFDSIQAQLILEYVERHMKKTTKLF